MILKIQAAVSVRPTKRKGHPAMSVRSRRSEPMISRREGHSHLTRVKLLVSQAPRGHHELSSGARKDHRAALRRTRAKIRSLSAWRVQERKRRRLPLLPPVLTCRHRARHGRRESSRGQTKENSNRTLRILFSVLTITHTAPHGTRAEVLSRVHSSWGRAELAVGGCFAERVRKRSRELVVRGAKAEVWRQKVAALRIEPCRVHLRQQVVSAGAEAV